jgi:hypothetical protein
MTYTDPQALAYRHFSPDRYARAHDLIELSRVLSEKAYQRADRRSGGYGCNCDEGRPCFEHRAAHRLLSIVESRGGR